MENKKIIPMEIIGTKIYVIRGKKVMLDRDLAELYGVETRVLNQAVRRNINRFPEDFMFKLTKEEFDNLKSQIVTSSWGGARKLPGAFTEQGIAMLSSVLKSERAIKVNIEIMRTFVKIHEYALSYKDLSEKINKLEKKYDKQFQIVFKALKQIIIPQKNEKKRKIGFKPPKKSKDKRGNK